MFTIEGTYATAECFVTHIDDIIGPIADSVDGRDVMRPGYNFKAQ